MPDVLLDTNIVIYLFKKDERCIAFIDALGEKEAGISIMTYMEALIGAKNDREEQAIRIFLDQFEIVPISLEIACRVAAWIRQRKQRSLRHVGASDTIIGQTALSLGISLATNNPRDFAAFSGLKIIVPD